MNPWVRTLICCWKDLFQGRACCIYNLLCCPLVTCWWATVIYCCGCVNVYLKRGMYKVCCCCCRTFNCCWLYKDKAFPPCPESLGNIGGDDANKDSGHSDSQIVWKRANDFANAGKMRLFGDTIDSRDICQGALGDCWLLAGMACLAEHRGAIASLFMTKETNPRGKYSVRLYDGVKEEWVRIVLDDFIPCDKKAYEKDGRTTPVFCQPNGNELYAMLLEKAFAKFCGSYANIEGGQTIWAIRAMTGDPARWFAMEDDKSGWKRQDLVNLESETDKRACTLRIKDEKYDDDTMFQLLLKYNSFKSVLCASSSSGECGLHKGHAYSILDVKTVDTGLFGVIGGKSFQFVKIRNPWGGGEWTGDWSDSSKLWDEHPKVKEALQYEDADDGSFWMTWQDYVKHWGRIGVVDRTVDINSLALRIEDDSLCAPVKGCCKGCCRFWCCCEGPCRLYCFHTSSDETIAVGGCCGGRCCSRTAKTVPVS
eukprot:TRINITY_DN37090_c0_g1_i1.p1 TRINITY_DN37090_c0_g1~~TRINITY_DN37090_c0_g1_i1.p1  ORF type:complete len:533 (+),score=82.12 TRINITY_DN37090_c0_g1_i1:158-1600(+)